MWGGDSGPGERGREYMVMWGGDSGSGEGKGSTW